MTASADIGREAQRLRALYAEKARAELAAADLLAPGSDAVPWSGDVLADVVVVKGLAGPAEAAGGAAVSGPDGEAVRKGLERLGHDPESLFCTLSRPEPGIDAEDRVARLVAQLEAVPAELVIALDPQAAADVAIAFGLDSLDYGVVERVQGRRVVALEGLEASLDDPGLKRKVWAQLSAAVPLPSVF